MYVMNVCAMYLWVYIRVCGAYADSCFVCQIVAKKIVFFCTNAKRKSARMGEGKVESKEEEATKR